MEMLRLDEERGFPITPASSKRLFYFQDGFQYVMKMVQSKRCSYCLMNI